MCRLLGYASLELDSKFQGKLEGLLDLMEKGGPDSKGTYVSENKNIFLGHRRLSILDLDKRSNQPFWDKSGRYCLVYNGEIYNFLSLREKLISQGEIFSTTSDTEVLLHGLIRDGVDFLNSCHGMWAFILYDKVLETITVCRDRYGVKPLYLYHSTEKLIISSEFKVFSALENDLSLNMSTEALSEYFEYGYVTAPSTFYKEVQKILPGTYAIFDKKLRRLEEKKWYKTKVKEKNKDYKFYLVELEEALAKSIELRLVADVPVAVFLSGGIDSSLVASLVAQRGVKLEAFSIGFHPNSYDESLLAENIAKYLGHNFNRIILSSQDVSQVFEEFEIDEPICDVSFLPTYLLSKVVSKKFKVALSGDGGDELFGGYTNYTKVDKAASLLRNMNFSGGIISRLKSQADPYLPSKLSKLDLDFSYAGLFHSSRRYLPKSIVKNLLHSGVEKTYEDSIHSIQDMMDFDFSHFMVDDVLAKVDRCSMQNGIELREPLLDQEIVELAQAIPTSLKFYDSFGKHPLRKVLSNYLPFELYNNPKRGLGIPYKSWLENDLLPWKSFILDNIDSIDLPMLNKSFVKKVLMNKSSSDLKANILVSLYFLLKWRTFAKKNVSSNSK